MTTVTETRDFPLGVVLSVTSGRLLCTMDEVYEVCAFLAGEPVWTHQLPRVSREATEPILDRYPELRDVEVPEGLDSFEKVNAWLASIAPTLGTSRALSPLYSDHTSVNPLDEIAMLRPDLPVIPLVIEDGPDA